MKRKRVACWEKGRLERGFMEDVECGVRGRRVKSTEYAVKWSASSRSAMSVPDFVLLVFPARINMDRWLEGGALELDFR
jgi:hypothetical protein